jgi:hypothetical protein
MNILILTPDRVGSTLLQRLVTVYANLNEDYKPLTINLHELTNGIVQYHNPKFNSTVLGKKEDGWGYHQNLKTIVNLLSNADHDITSRLAYYHIKNRKDSLADQLDFYKYLNENFYIICARRKNLFEHAMSWCIAAESKKLNVYSVEEKYNIFSKIHEQGITVQSESVEKYLNQYQEYLEWVDRHFQVNSYFEYERDMPNIENFILGLNIFKSITNKLTWQDRFGISWNDWNRMHYLLSLVPFGQQFTDEEKEFIKLNTATYSKARIDIQDLQDDGILVSGIPIKLHTLQQKAQVITNIGQCLEYYNGWVGKNNPTNAIAYHPVAMTKIAQLEHSQWTSDIGFRSVLTTDDISNQQLLESDLKFS